MTAFGDQLKGFALRIDASFTRLGPRSTCLALSRGDLWSHLVEEVRDGYIQHLCELK